MRYAEVANVIAGIGLPYAYRSFPQSTNKQPPYIVYYYTGTDDLYADNSNYQEIAAIRIELYTRNKDFASERAVENQLRANDFTWTKEETFIEDEKMYLIVYESEVIIHG